MTLLYDCGIRWTLSGDLGVQGVQPPEDIDIEDFKHCNPVYPHAALFIYMQPTVTTCNPL